MKIILTLVCYLCLSTSAFAQTNLIQNPGFESEWSYWTPDNDDAHYCFVASPTTSMLWYFLDPANPITVLTTPPNVYFGTQTPFEGSKFMGIMAYFDATLSVCCADKAKIGYQLPSGLDPDKEYVLSFRVSKMDNSTRQPYLKVYVNDAFTNVVLGENEIIKQFITDDGSSANTEWQLMQAVFKPSGTGNDWLIFKMANDFFLDGSQWSGVYLDDVHLYEYCDYNASLNNSGCLQSNGNMVVVPGPLALSPTVLYHWHDDPFYIRNLQSISNVRMKIYTSTGVLVKTIEKESRNGIWQNIYWDGRNEAGGEQAAAEYIAVVQSWNGGSYVAQRTVWDLVLPNCNYQEHTFHFIKLNGTMDFTIDVDNDLTHGGTIDLNGPPAYNWCCSYMPNLTLSNLHYKANDLGSYNNIGTYYYKSTNKITFGPNITVDAGATVSMTAPNIITVPSGSSIQGNVQMHLIPCTQRLANPDLPYRSENDFLIPDSNSLSSLDIERLIDRIKSAKTEYIIYPNPTANGKANIFLKEGGYNNIFVGIYNMLGECVQYSIAPSVGEFLIDLSSKQKGIYLIRIFEPNETRVFKLVYHDGR
jgi:hypothetical protein